MSTPIHCHRLWLFELIIAVVSHLLPRAVILTSLPLHGVCFARTCLAITKSKKWTLSYYTERFHLKAERVISNLNEGEFSLILTVKPLSGLFDCPDFSLSVVT